MNKKKALIATIAFMLFTVPAFGNYQENEHVDENLGDPEQTYISQPSATPATDEEVDEDEEEATVTTSLTPVAAPTVDVDFPEEYLELTTIQLRLLLQRRVITQAQFNAIMRARLATNLQAQTTAAAPAPTAPVEDIEAAEENDEEAIEDVEENEEENDEEAEAAE